MLAFEIQRETLGSQMQAALIEAEIKRAASDEEIKNFPGALQKFTRLLANTTAIRLPESDVPQVKALQALWEGRAHTPPVELWRQYIALDAEIAGAWIDQFDARHKPLLPVWEKDKRLWTEAELKELENPDSFLASAATSSK